MAKQRLTRTWADLDIMTEDEQDRWQILENTYPEKLHLNNENAERDIQEALDEIKDEQSEIIRKARQRARKDQRSPQGEDRLH